MTQLTLEVPKQTRDRIGVHLRRNAEHFGEKLVHHQYAGFVQLSALAESTLKPAPKVGHFAGCEATPAEFLEDGVKWLNNVLEVASEPLPLLMNHFEQKFVDRIDRIGVPQDSRRTRHRRSS